MIFEVSKITGSQRWLKITALAIAVGEIWCSEPHGASVHHPPDVGR